MGMEENGRLEVSYHSLLVLKLLRYRLMHAFIYSCIIVKSFPHLDAFLILSCKNRHNLIVLNELSQCFNCVRVLQHYGYPNSN